MKMSSISDDYLFSDEEEEMRNLSERSTKQQLKDERSDQDKLFQAWLLLSLQYMSTCYKVMSDELLSCPHQRGTCCCYRRNYTQKMGRPRRLFSPNGAPPCVVPPPTSGGTYASVAYSRDSGIDDSLTVTSVGDDDSVIDDDMVVNSADSTMARSRPVCTSTPNVDNQPNYDAAAQSPTQDKVVDGPILTSLQRRIKQHNIAMAKSQDALFNHTPEVHQKRSAPQHTDIIKQDQLELYNKQKTRSATAPSIKLCTYTLPPAGDFAAELPLVTTAEDTVGRVWLGNQVLETKYVTTVFEGVKLEGLLRDVQEEMRQWIADSGLVIACELVWSFPADNRDKDKEMRLKDSLLKSLRHSNRRVLDLQHDVNTPGHVPMLMPDARTAEVAGVDNKKQCYQGIYRRTYAGLLPAQHKQTAPVHQPHWALQSDRAEMKPNPENFMYGKNRRPAELKNRCLIALNVIALKLGKAKKKVAKTVIPGKRVEVSATSESLGSEATRLLRVRVLDANDNAPLFARTAHTPPEMLVVLPGAPAGTVIGRVTAHDADQSEEHTTFAYAIISTCGDRQRENFEVDMQSGELRTTKEVRELAGTDVQLCILATPDIGRAHAGPVNIAYDPDDLSMTRVIAHIVDASPVLQHKQLTNVKQERNDAVLSTLPNNTVIQADTHTAGEVMPQHDAPQTTSLTFLLSSAKFTDSSGGISAVSDQAKKQLGVDERDGTIRTAPQLANTLGSGVLDTKVDVFDAANKKHVGVLHHAVHIVDAEDKLAFVFEPERAQSLAEIDQFTNKLSSLLLEHGLRVHFDTHAERLPEEHEHAGQSQLCFYAERSAARLLPAQTAKQRLSDIAHKDKTLKEFYKAHGAADIRECSTRAAEVSTAASVLSAAVEHIWIVLAALLAALIVLTLICYLCFLHRYKRYMAEQNEFERAVAASNANGAAMRTDNVRARSADPPMPRFMQSCVALQPLHLNICIVLLRTVW